MMSVLGIILLFISLGFFMYVYKVEKERDRLEYIFPLISAFGIMGFVLIFQERIIEFPIPGVGPIKTIAERTLKDAEQVDEIKRIVLAQGETIGFVANRAKEIQPEVSRIADEVKRFDLFLHETKNNLQEGYQAVSKEIEAIKLQSRLPLLSNRAIS
jgi:Serpentine type 7TM GPCR chemoreceptor Srz